MPVELLQGETAPPINLSPAPPPSPLAKMVFHPRYERFLRRWGIDTPDAALGLHGEVICGHPDRHVVRVVLGSRVLFLKREHVVGLRTRLRNRFAGYGWVSRSEREAVTLQRLEGAGLPGPQWLAYGEDGAGRAFLLIDELAGRLDLRDVLGDATLSPADRRELSAQVGRAVAELHEGGFGTPELAAKHLFINPETFAATLIDWQSSPRRPITAAERTRQLAGLNASLADGLASPRERLHCLWTYWRHLARGTAPRFSEFVRAVVAESGRKAGRSSARDQRQLTPAPRLVWVEGEQVCAIPEIAANWPRPAVREPFYPDRPTIDVRSTEEWVTFPNGRRGLVVRFASCDPVGRLVAAAREKPWRSPGAVASRVLIHLERYGVLAPRLLAFGQRLTSPLSAESFVLYEPLRQAVPVSVRSTQSRGDRSLLRACGETVRKLHDAGCRLVTGRGPSLMVSGASVGVESPFVVRLTKRMTEPRRRADLRRVVRTELGVLGRADLARVLRGYLGDSADRATRKSWLAGLI